MTLIISGEEENIFFSFLLFILCTWVFCLYICLCFMCVPGAHGDLKKTLGPMEPELEMAAVTVLVLGIKPCPL